MFFNLRKKSGNLNIGLIAGIVFVCFTAGISFGCNGFILEEENVEEIIKSFTMTHKFDITVYDAFLKNFIFVTCLFLCGTSIAGSLGVTYLMFIKGVSIGSSICAVISVADANKLSVLFNVIPQQLFFISGCVCMSVSSILYSLTIIRKTLLKKSKLKIEYPFYIFIATFVISVCFCYFSALCESFFVPVLG